MVQGIVANQSNPISSMLEAFCLIKPSQNPYGKEPVIYNIIIFIILFLCKKTVQFKGIIDSNMKYLEIISEQNELRRREHGKEKVG